MAFGKRDSTQVIWGVLLIAMGILLFVTTPPALRLSPDSGFLNFCRYFIAIFLILGGGKKLYRHYLVKDKEPPSDG